MNRSKNTEKLLAAKKALEAALKNLNDQIKIVSLIEDQKPIVMGTTQLVNFFIDTATKEMVKF